MAWYDISEFILDDVFGYQSANKIRENIIYLKDNFEATAEIKKPFDFVWALKLPYDDGDVTFIDGEIITGATSGAKGTVEYVDGSYNNGNLYVTYWNGTEFTDDEIITGSVSGDAVVNGSASKNSLIIYPFAMMHKGTITQKVYSTTKIAYDLADTSAEEWQHIYISDAAVQSAESPVVTSAELLNSSDEPAFSQSKNGWYDGDNRLIFTCRMDASNNILGFVVDESGYVEFDSAITLYSIYVTTTAWHTVTAIAPIYRSGRQYLTVSSAGDEIYDLTAATVPLRRGPGDQYRVYCTHVEQNYYAYIRISVYDLPDI